MDAEGGSRMSLMVVGTPNADNDLAGPLKAVW